jgi:hypothetical protein
MLLGQETLLRQGYAGQARSCPAELLPHLADEVIAWLRQQLGQPTARKRDLTALAEQLRGKELTAREVLRIVQEWLGAEDDDVIQVA